MDSKHPRAIVLCATEEKANEVLGDESPIVKHLERDHAENIYVIDIGLVI